MSKTIVITGASRGIGRAIALRLAQPGNRIVLNCARRADDLQEVCDLVSQKGAQCRTFIGDISSYNKAQELFKLAHQEFGPVDILINNAGISIVGLFQDMSREDWDRMINTNLGSVYNCCHFAVSDMIHAQCGKIINISSVWGIAGASCEVAYSASKGAINAFTRALAKELAPSNIQVNAIACGAIDTEMNSFLSNEERNMLIDEIPTGRLGRPEEVADLAYDMVTGHSYLTAQVIQLDGGWI